MTSIFPIKYCYILLEVVPADLACYITLFAFEIAHQLAPSAEICSLISLLWQNGVNIFAAPKMYVHFAPLPETLFCISCPPQLATRNRAQAGLPYKGWPQTGKDVSQTSSLDNFASGKHYEKMMIATQRRQCLCRCKSGACRRADGSKLCAMRDR